MISRITIATLIALVASLAATWFFQRRAATLADELNVANQKIAAHEEAARVLNSYLDKQKAAAEYWRDEIEALDKKEGRDEPLNPYELSVLERVRKAH